MSKFFRHLEGYPGRCHICDFSSNHETQGDFFLGLSDSGEPRTLLLNDGEVICSVCLEESYGSLDVFEEEENNYGNNSTK